MHVVSYRSLRSSRVFQSVVHFGSAYPTRRTPAFQAYFYPFLSVEKFVLAGYKRRRGSGRHCPSRRRCTAAQPSLDPNLPESDCFVPAAPGSSGFNTVRPRFPQFVFLSVYLTFSGEKSLYKINPRKNVLFRNFKIHSMWIFFSKFA